MSNPASHVREAETLNVGMLAAKTSAALRKAEAGQPLSAQERQILERAERFVRQVAVGAQLITTGAGAGGAAIGSVEALGYAVRPIEALEETLGDVVVADSLSNMATTLHQARDHVGGLFPVNNVAEVRSFFDRLYESLLGRIEHGRAHPTSRKDSSTSMYVAG